MLMLRYANWIWHSYRKICLLVLAFFLLAIGLGVRGSIVSNECLTKGYPNARIAWGGFGQAFCIKRVNQTDVVVPLSSL